MRATVLALTLVAVSCSRMVPWGDEPVGEEVNMAFTLEQNLVRLQSVRLGNRQGRFILGSATRRSVIDANFPLEGPDARMLQLGERETLRIDPLPYDLRGVADLVIGAEVWRDHAISIDYRTGLVTYQKEGINRGLMQIFEFSAEPMINVIVNGREVPAIVDTACPDTLVLPGRSPGRGMADVRIGATHFGPTGVQYADVQHARVGNRLLSRFLVTIDYGQKVVGLWRDPRIPLHEPVEPPAVEPESPVPPPR